MNKPHLVWQRAGVTVTVNGKVDRSGTYMARKIARDIVLAGYASKCEIQIAYASVKKINLGKNNEKQQL